METWRQRQLVTTAEDGSWGEVFLGDRLWRGWSGITIVKGIECHTGVGALSHRGGKPGMVLSTRGTQ